METVETLVIGAGVIGLACAKTLAESGQEVIVLESADAIGTQTSSRNSEVIHAGIYYPAGSLKSALCVAGKQLLYEYCADRGVPHRRCGKLIVATSDEEEGQLEAIRLKAEANGVTDLEWLSGSDAGHLEPALRCTRALLSPSTGIVDSHSLMLAYQGDLESAGGMIAFNTPVDGGVIDESGFEIRTGGDHPMTLRLKRLVIAGGLTSQSIANGLSGYPIETLPGQYFCKGNYFTTAFKSPFRRLIYPVPVKSGLGVHVTVDMGGGLRFGPDTEWIDSLDGPDLYEVDATRGDSFYTAIRRYYPDLPDASLMAGYAGIRPKLNRAGAVGEDFRIDTPDWHGVPRLVGLYGIESPGLTASLAIARYVAARAG